MKTFIVNLVRQPEKKIAIETQCNNLGLNISFIEAIDGKFLSDTNLIELCPEFPTNFLTKGEIGCSLSHLKIYEQMVSEKIEIALVLEDDAILSNELPEILLEIDANNQVDKPNVYLLGDVVSFIKNGCMVRNNITIYKAYDACYTYGYIINLAAAKNLLKKLKPIRFEADRWEYFRDSGLINLFCVIPPPISTNDESKEHSDLEIERIKLKMQRNNYYHKLIKQDRKTRWKRRLWRGLVKPFITIIRLRF